jgi:TRAP-type C4-dicarboxylate transport system permease small subunit
MIDRFFELATRVIERTLALALIVGVCLNFANVVDRYVLGGSILGADELQVFIMVWMTFLAAAVVAWRGKHLRMDALARFLPGRLRAALRAAELAVLILLAGLTLALSAQYTWNMFVLQQKSNTAGIPMWIPHGAVPLGFGLIALIAVWQAIRFLRSARAGRRATDDVGEERARS